MTNMRLTLLLLIIPCAIGAAPDVRKVSWGMTIPQVTAIEGKPADDAEPGILAYKTTIYGEKADLGFFFFDGQLINVIYSMRMDANQIMGMYDKFLAALKEKYGEATKEKDDWQSAFMKDNPGNAIAYGQLTRTTMWQNDRTRIVLLAKKDEMLRTQLVLFYASITLTEKETEAAKRKAKDDL